jgi:hypothetical protein
MRFAIGQRTTTRQHVQAAWEVITETARGLRRGGLGRLDTPDRREG